jgi:hypothetical protein
MLVEKAGIEDAEEILALQKKPMPAKGGYITT